MKRHKNPVFRYAMIITLGLVMMALTMVNLHAQIDENRMQKDLEVMEKFLVEWFKAGNPDPDRLSLNTHSVSSRYTPGFGVLIRTPKYSNRGLSVIGRGSNYQYRYHDGQLSNIGITQAPRDSDQATDNTVEMLQDSILNLMVSFLASYGDLASELPGDKQIMLIYGQNEKNRSFNVSSAHSLTVSGFNNRESINKVGNISVAVEKSALEDFRVGKMSANGLYQAMRIVEAESEEAVPLEFKVFGRILKDVMDVRNYEETLAKAYAEKVKKRSNNDDAEGNDDRDSEIKYVFGSANTQDFPAVIWDGSSRLNFEMLDGYGAVYQLRGSSPRHRSNTIIISGRKGRTKGINLDQDIYQEEDADRELDTDKWVDLYAEALVAEMKRTMIEYGRTLRKLEKDEWLTILIDLPSCEACNAPSQLELRVPQQVLEQYDSRKINLDTAMDRINTRAIGKASDKKESYPSILHGRWGNDDE